MLVTMGPRLVLTIAIGVLTGCTTVQHTPLYLPQAHSSTITAFSFYLEGVKRISLHVMIGEMTDCTELGGPASVIPCRQNAVPDNWVCDYTGSTRVAAFCTHAWDLPDKSIVTYYVESELSAGTIRRTQPITYAAGDFPMVGVARPIWWHHNLVGNADWDSKINIGFFPDTCSPACSRPDGTEYDDYIKLGYESFAQDLEMIVQGAFFGEQAFSSAYTFFRSSVNLWAAPFGAEATVRYDQFGDVHCDERVFNNVVSPIESQMDGNVILQRKFWRDCATLALGRQASGSTYTILPLPFPNSHLVPSARFVHESGHFLHEQADEYKEGGFYDGYSNVACANVFRDAVSCVDAAPTHNIPMSDSACERIGWTPWYRRMGAHDLMEDDGIQSQWQSDCLYCVVQRFFRCRSGNCYP